MGYFNQARQGFAALVKRPMRRSTRLLCWGLLAMLPLSGCLKVLLEPRRNFVAYTLGPAPNYELDSCWAALPTRRDSADAVPRTSGLRDEQAAAAADVFFVHPTTLYLPFAWNADLRKRWLNRYTDRSTIRQQASAFNAAARIYAPRYRQATLYTFLDIQAQKQIPNGQEALDLAYGDVRAAFQYYLAHYNQRRPIIIAGHSQGTAHATRLLHEFFDHDPTLRRQLVAAYLVGFQVKPHEFQTIVPCPDSLATGCFISYNSVATGKESKLFQPSTVTNPLTWTLDTLLAPATLNRGGVGLDFKAIDPHPTSAQIHRGQLWITPPKTGKYPRFPPSGRPELRYSYHIADYALFYMNIRENAKARVRAWQLRNR
jgi:hypothetical protein